MSTTTTHALTNPYVGPRSFQQGERIYGRDREAKDLLGLLIAERIVLLHSPSGAGKTSLLQAALIPQLRANEFTVLPTIRVSLELNERNAAAVEQASNGDELLVGDDVNWFATMRGAARPNRYVLSALLSLEDDLPSEQRTATEQLLTLTLDTYLTQREEQLGDRDIVLIFDQFEEVLTIDPTDTAAKAAFFAQLGAALRNRGRWALFSMREDYVASLAPYLRPIPTRLSTTFRLDLLDSAAARMAVQQPAALHGVTFSDEAAARLIDDLRRTQVQLADGRVDVQLGPHVEPVQLQVVCLRLWDKLAAQRGWQAANPIPEFVAEAEAELDDSEPVSTVFVSAPIDSITVADVETIGNVDNALATYYADKVGAVVATTGNNERQIREWFDRELITPQGLRGQVLQSAEQSAGLPNTTIGELIDSYLVRGEKRRGMTWFELSHDRLLAPVRENNAAWFLAHLSTLQRQADLWERQGQPDGLLLQGDALYEAEAWAAANSATLLQIERDFLEKSQRAQAVIEREQRQQRRIRLLAISSSALSVLAIIALIGALLAYRNAERERRIALARGLAAASTVQLSKDPEMSVILAREGVLVSRTPEGEVDRDALNALYNAIGTSRVERSFQQDDNTRGVAYSPDEQLLATGSSDGDVTLYSLADGSERLIGNTGSTVRRVSFDPAGAQLAATSGDGEIYIWQLTDGSSRSLPEGDTILDIAFSPDGRTLAAVGNSQIVSLWNLADGSRTDLTPEADDTLTSVAFSPDGRQLAATGDDGILRIWDLATQTQRAEDLALGRFNDLAYSPDGRRIALVMGNEPYEALVWDLQERTIVTRMLGHSNSILGMSWAAEREIIATAATDGTARIWDAQSGRPLLTLLGHTERVNAAVLTSDGSGVSTTSNDGTVRVWNLRFMLPEVVQAIDLAPSGDTLAAVGLQGTLWTLTVEQPAVVGGGLNPQPDRSGRVSSVTRRFEQPMLDVAYSRDGRFLATANENGIVALYDSQLDQARELRHDNQLRALDFSPDGTLLATANDDRQVQIWATADGSLLHTWTTPDDLIIFDVSFHADGRQLAIAQDDGTAYLWQIDQAEAEIFATLDDSQATVAFSPDSSLLAFGGVDGTISVYKSATRELAFPPRAHKGRVNSIAFSPDGSLLASASADQTARVWRTSDGREQFAVAHTINVLDVAFTSDRMSVFTAAADGMVRRFPLQADDLIAQAGRQITRLPSAEECSEFHLEQQPICAAASAP